MAGALYGGLGRGMYESIGLDRDQVRPGCAQPVGCVSGAGAMKQHGIKRATAACAITVKNLLLKLQPAATEKLSLQDAPGRAVRARDMKFTCAVSLAPWRVFLCGRAGPDRKMTCGAEDRARNWRGSGEELARSAAGDLW